MASVYIETTIPSFYLETRQDPRSIAWRDATRDWWDNHRGRYEIVTSSLVLRELRQAPAPKSESDGSHAHRRTPARRDAGPDRDRGVLLGAPAAARECARRCPLHLAMASTHTIDYLLTWNIRHLANANKTRHLSVLNGRLGLPSPIITTPELLMPELEP